MVSYVLENFGFYNQFLREREYEALVQRLWDELRVMVPLETRYAKSTSGMCYPRN